MRIRGGKLVPPELLYQSDNRLIQALRSISQYYDMGIGEVGGSDSKYELALGNIPIEIYATIFGH